MEVSKEGLIKRLFLSERVPFSQKRDINWRAVKWTMIAFIGGFVLVVLVLPSSPEPTSSQESLAGASPRLQAEAQPPQPLANEMVPTAHSLSAYYGAPSGGASPPSRAGSMILTRGGLDYRTQLPPGSRIKVRLLQGAIVSSESMPIIATVIEDVAHENGVAIERGSKLFGEASFDDGGDVATVTWTSIQLADGRERQMSAIGASLSGHVGVQGKVHSKRVQNVGGGMISRFIGAYAEGSVSRGVLGFSTGGAENGLKSAVAATAKDQADSYASDLKKEKRWIELEAGAESLAVLKQPFTFRDPGSYGR